MLLEIVRHTPLWVFALLAALVWLGVRRMRPGTLSRTQLLAMPAAMAGLSLVGLAQSFGLGAGAFAAFATWAVAYGAMLASSRALPPTDGVRYAPATKTFAIPGSALPLALMMTIFFTRYAVAVLLAVHPALHDASWFVAGVGALYGLTSCAFAARASMTWRAAFGTVASQRAVAVA